MSLRGPYFATRPYSTSEADNAHRVDYGSMKRAPAALLASLLSLPAVGSAFVLLSMPPFSRWLPAPALAIVRDVAAIPFDLVASIPPDSLAGRVFYGTYEPLIPIFGAHALAAHSLLLSLPFLVAATLVARHAHVALPTRA